MVAIRPPAPPETERALEVPKGATVADALAGLGLQKPDGHATLLNDNSVPAGTRATALPSPEMNHAFLKAFGQPSRTTACTCERTTEPQLAQALEFLRGDLVHGKLESSGNRFRKALAAGRNDQEIVRELYWTAFSRPPTEVEEASAQRHIAAANDRAAALADVCWAILNTNEFMFQH